MAERFIGQDLIRYLQSGKYGNDQWAFTPGLSSRDLLSALVMTWILHIVRGSKIAAFLGDISGAFDRVFKDYLMAKLYVAGVGPLYLNFIDAYLQPRKAQVIVEGEASDPFDIQNTVFQGTVLGPALWNLFFADVSIPAQSSGGSSFKFADDLSVFQAFDRHEENNVLIRRLGICRERVHKWGRLNRVAFDATKEHLAILHPYSGEGDDFKLLGCMFDCKLTMRQAIERIMSQVRPKILAILRTKQHYSVKDLIGQFKTHIWGIMAQHTGAIFHSANYLLDKLDNCQTRFLNEIGISEIDAFLEFNFAPLRLRRNIGVLGLLHKRVLGLAHPIFQDLLPFHDHSQHGASTGNHTRQLYGHALDVVFQSSLYHKSIFSMVHIYNRLPQKTIDKKTVSDFQRDLTFITRASCREGVQD